MEIPIHQVDAFADRLFAGNPAAVCPLEDWLSDELMQSIAVENNLSETAFIVHEPEGWRIRWFTPGGEVDLCGHATLGTAWVMFRHGMIEGDEVRFQSRSGELRVAREGERLTLDFPVLPMEGCEVPEEMKTGLGIRPVEVYRGMDYMAVLESEEQVLSLNPEFHILRRFGLRGVIVTAPGIEVDFVCRYFAPAYGIDEDPVTGSAHCALAPYWAKRLGRPDLTARQLSRRGGSLFCRVQNGRVLISGRVIPYLTGTIRL